MMRKSVGALILLLSIWSSNLTAQTLARIRGVVMDGGGNAVDGAEIFVEASGAAVLAGRDGRFVVALPAGRVTGIRISAPGYAPERVSVAAGDDMVRVVLTQTPLSLPGLQVTATPSARDALSITQSTAQLAGRSLEREQASSIAETLRRQPGVAVRSMGPAATMPMVRGLTGDRLLVLQDGRRSGDLAGSADDHGVTIDPLAAQRIEVVRGPATVMYGNNAMGGVVNVVSGDIPDGGVHHAQGAVAAHSESAMPGGAVSGRVEAPIGNNWAVSARGTGRATDDVRIPRDPLLGTRLANTQASSTGGAVGIGRSGERTSGGVALRLHDFAYGLPLPPDADPVSLRGGRLEVGARLRHSPGAGRISAISVDGSSQRYAHDEVDDLSNSRLQRFELTTHTLDLVGRHTVGGEGAWGVSFLGKRYAAAGEAALTPPADSRGIGLFGFHELPLGGGGAPTLMMGGRYDDYRIVSRRSERFGDGVSRRFGALSGALGVRVPLGGAISASVHAARSFRAPTVEELFSGAAHAGTGAVEFGDPALRSEVGHAIEATLRARTPRLDAQLSAHRNVIDDFVHLRAAGDTVVYGVTLPVLRYGQDRAVLQGVEGSLEWAVTPRVVIGGMGDYLHAATSDGTPLSYMPPPRAGILARWDDGRIALGGDVHHEFAQNRVGASDERPTPAHTILRLHAGLRLRFAGREHSFTLRGENLTNELHREATSRIKDFAPGPGRNISLGYRIVF